MNIAEFLGVPIITSMGVIGMIGGAISNEPVAIITGTVGFFVMLPLLASVIARHVKSEIED